MGKQLFDKTVRDILAEAGVAQVTDDERRMVEEVLRCISRGEMGISDTQRSLRIGYNCASAVVERIRSHQLNREDTMEKLFVDPDFVLRSLEGEIRTTSKRSNAFAAFHKEAHFQAALAADLRRQYSRLFPVVEAAYLDYGHDRADICLLNKEKHPRVWIEIKKSWYGQEGKRPDGSFHNKQREQLENLLWDSAKILYQIVQSPAQGVLVTLFYNQKTTPFSNWRKKACCKSMQARNALLRWREKRALNRDLAIFGEMNLPSGFSPSELPGVYVATIKSVGKVECKQLKDVDDRYDYLVVVAELK